MGDGIYINYGNLLTTIVLEGEDDDHGGNTDRQGS